MDISEISEFSRVNKILKAMRFKNNGNSFVTPEIITRKVFGSGIPRKDDYEQINHELDILRELGLVVRVSIDIGNNRIFAFCRTKATDSIIVLS